MIDSLPHVPLYVLVLWVVTQIMRCLMKPYDVWLQAENNKKIDYVKDIKDID